MSIVVHKGLQLADEVQAEVAHVAPVPEGLDVHVGIIGAHGRDEVKQVGNGIGMAREPHYEQKHFLRLIKKLFLMTLYRPQNRVWH